MKNGTNTTAERSVKMWPGILSGVTIGLIAFILSFDALRLVFVACGINPYLSWGGPVCVDGTILLCTWATWGFEKGRIRGAWYPWAGLVLFSGFSIGGNALHAIINTGYELPSWVPPVIMSIPPIALLYATHLIVIIAGDRLDKTAGAEGNGTDEPATDGTREPEAIEPAAVPPVPPAVPAIRTMPAPGEADAARTTPVDLSDWRITVPDMEADARPKAVEAEAHDAEASTPITIPNAEDPRGGDDTDDAEPAAIDPDAPTADGTVQEDAETPRPAGDEGTHGNDAAATPGDGGADGAWNAWLDDMEREGRDATARMALEAGLASSMADAKRHLARVRRQREERA